MATPAPKPKKAIQGQFGIGDYAKHYNISEQHAREKLRMLLDERIVSCAVRDRRRVFEFKGRTK